MLALSIVLLLISLFSHTVTILEGLLLFSFSLFIVCQKELSPIAYRVPSSRFSISLSFFWWR
jgi:hypothetical protein